MSLLVRFFKKDIFVLFLIIAFNLLFIIFIKNAIPLPIHYILRNVFIFELFGYNIFLTFPVLILFQILNITLLWLIGKELFLRNYPILPAVIYSIVPWSSYLVFAESVYIFLLFFILTIILGLIYLSKKNKLANLLLGFGIIGCLFTSITMMFLIPIFLLAVLVLKLIKFKDLKLIWLIFLVVFVPLLVVVKNNNESFKNISQKQIKIFYDPGLLNTVNSYQGAALEEGLTPLAKISENKYLYYNEFFLYKYLKNLLPATFFTSQEKLLEFSFNPPIYLGFMIPFLYGIYILIQNSRARKWFLVSTLLIIPSVLWKLPVDLNRLVLFLPIILIIITFGFNYMYSLRRTKATTFFWLLTLFLVIFQISVCFADIQSKELIRFKRYLNDRYEIDK